MFLIFLVTFIGLCYLWMKRHYNYWNSVGVPQGNPPFVVGDSSKMIFRQRSVPELMNDWYNVHPSSRYYGVYQFFTPTLLLRDPELIKQIAIKEFEHFVDHRGFISPDEPLFGKNLFSLRGQKWKEMRSILSPAFTSSRMKFIFSLIIKTGEQFVDHLSQHKEPIIELEAKDTLTKFVNDVIASAAYGIEIDSLKDPNNKFYLMGKDATDFVNFKRFLKFMTSFFVPALFRLLKMRVFTKELEVFFLTLVKENIESREKQGIVRPDMIHLLMEARKHGLKHDENQTLPDTGFATVEESDLGKKTVTGKTDLSDEDITAQAFIFFLAGFETVSTALCFLTHELSVNPDVQDRLRQEIDKTLEECNGILTYEALMHMKYMDMVVSESMRKWPNGIALDRLCTKPFTIEAKFSHEKPVYMKKDSVLIIPIYGLHRDPQYFPDPERFDPERFSDANRKNIKPYTYFPFGLGPRACIGSRFALMEIKVLLFHLLGKFEIVPIKKTQIPLRLNQKAGNMDAEKGFWVGLKHRIK